MKDKYEPFPEKTFGRDLEALLHKLDNRENFAFNRFSDGEMYILQNKKLELGDGYINIDGKTQRGYYSSVDHKFFDPEKNPEVRKYLVNAIMHEQKNYYKGISCPCCVGDIDAKYMYNMAKGTDEWDEQITWANLFVNSNYPYFMENFVPVLCEDDMKIVLICNENCDLTRIKQEMNIVKDFSVGYNCIVNDMKLLFEIYDWIKYGDEKNSDAGGKFYGSKYYKIKNHVFLFSASALSKYLIHELFYSFPENTFIDIGTTLNAYLGMPLDRAYLRAYYLNSGEGDLTKECIWFENNEKEMSCLK